jgi:hypothetical protein
VLDSYTFTNVSIIQIIANEANYPLVGSVDVALLYFIDCELIEKLTRKAEGLIVLSI